MSDAPPGPFARPLFQDPEARKLSRVGVVDVGSNSVRMVVFDGAARSPAYFYNEKIMCGLGLGLRDTGRLNPEGRDRALAALERFQALAEEMGLPPLTTVATAAVRDAEDGPEFCAEVARRTGITLYVIDGREEARLSAQGVLLGWPGCDGLVCDIGGASMELARVSPGTVGQRMTSDLGPQKLIGMKGGKKALRKHIAQGVDQLFDQMGQPKGQRLFLVGGSWRAIAKIDMHRRGYPLGVLHEYRMAARDISKTGALIDRSDVDSLRQDCGISGSRMALVPVASLVLRQLVRRFSPKDICISAYGIREGMLYEQMPPALRARDPLIEASLFAEAKDARLPGKGQLLYDFIAPLFPRASLAKTRLLQAACLLHDVSWRAHADFRPETCFEMVTRANLSGLTHQERVFLGMALMVRYSNKPPHARFDPLLALLTEAQKQEARVLGRAMRLGAMLWKSPSQAAATLAWRPKKRVVELRMRPGAERLLGEVARGRLNSLAQQLDAEARILPSA